jgi:hypothetical protein
MHISIRDVTVTAVVLLVLPLHGTNYHYQYYRSGCTVKIDWLHLPGISTSFSTHTCKMKEKVLLVERVTTQNQYLPYQAITDELWFALSKFMIDF